MGSRPIGTRTSRWSSRPSMRLGPESGSELMSPGQCVRYSCTSESSIEDRGRLELAVEDDSTAGGQLAPVDGEPLERNAVVIPPERVGHADGHELVRRLEHADRAGYLAPADRVALADMGEVTHARALPQDGPCRMPAHCKNTRSSRR